MCVIKTKITQKNFEILTWNIQGSDVMKFFSLHTQHTYTSSILKIYTHITRLTQNFGSLFMAQNSKRLVSFLDLALEILIILSSLSFKNFLCNFDFSYTHTRLHKIAQKSCVITHTRVSAREPCKKVPADQVLQPWQQAARGAAVGRFIHGGEVPAQIFRG